jgi:hypothetical protein
MTAVLLDRSTREIKYQQHNIATDFTIAGTTHDIDMDRQEENNNNSNLPFLRLPVELRIQIYELVVNSCLTRTTQNLRDNIFYLRPVPHESHYSSLTQVCQQIRSDLILDKTYERLLKIEVTEDEKTWRVLGASEVERLPWLQMHGAYDIQSEKERMAAVPKFGARRRTGLVVLGRYPEMGPWIFYKSLEVRKAQWSDGLVRLGTVSRV